MKRLWKRVGLGIGCALLVACGSSGCASSGPVGNPVARTVTWFSYVNGDDLRATCRAGNPDRYRLIYNGNYLEQTRTYDLTAEGDGAALVGRVVGEVNLALGIPVFDPLAPWRGQSFSARLQSAPLRDLREALALSGPGAGKGFELPSDSFFWVAAYCQNGTFRFTAWAYPSAAFDALAFVNVLLVRDTSGVPLNKARPIAYLTLREQEEARRFVLKVGDNGLASF